MITISDCAIDFKQIYEVDHGCLHWGAGHGKDPAVDGSFDIKGDAEVVEECQSVVSSTNYTAAVHGV